MQTATQISHVFQAAIGITLVIISFSVSWFITTLLSKRQSARRERVEQAAAQIRSQIFSTKEAYRGKYMPCALQALLDQSWRDSAALGRYFDCSESYTTDMETEAAEVIESIKRLAETAPTAFNLEADSLALKQELTEFEENNLQLIEALNQELAEFEEDNRQQIESLYQDLASERARIACALEQIEELKNLDSMTIEVTTGASAAVFRFRITAVYHIGESQGRATMNVTTDLDLMSSKAEEEELIDQAIEQAKAILRERLAKEMAVPIEEVCIDGYSVAPSEN